MLDRGTTWLLRITLSLAILTLVWVGFGQVWVWAQQNLVARSQLMATLQACEREKAKPAPLR